MFDVTNLSSNVKTILLIGATSGLGVILARHFHFSGKKTIASGRRIEQRNAVESELPGLETVQPDVTDFEPRIQSLHHHPPDLDSVFIISGKMKPTKFRSPASTSSISIISEVNTNLTAPFLISRVMVPHLLALPRYATLTTISLCLD
ncbi:putative oxidoreductase [Lachnellula occidentalis]|uniref:Putative oxidoreductase n=1 Tax=Lachnellula occidentalis TaxID=215460 RepID=A0A8H8RC94_9HELO|nr:putative oxidoreductase [Lachnellula occidentalis]